MFYNSKENFKQHSDERIVIFGKGKVFDDFLLEYPECASKIDLFIDNKCSDGETKTIAVGAHENIDINVKNPADLDENDLGQKIIIFCSKYWKEMKEQLEVLHKDTWYQYFHFPFYTDYAGEDKRCIENRVINPFLYYTKEYAVENTMFQVCNCETADELREKVVNRELTVVPRLSIIVTPYCSLNCKNCVNLMPFFRGKEIRIDIEKTKRTMTKLLDIVDCISVCELVGGEPFISQNLKEMLELLLSNNKILKVEITTNGTVCPQKDLINLLKNKKLMVCVSDYSSVVDQKPFVDFLEANEIGYKIIRHATWIVPGGIEKRNKQDKDLVLQYYNCPSTSHCRTLWEDTLYPCPRAASVSSLLNEKFGISINKILDLHEMLNSFMLDSLHEACDYCDLWMEKDIYVVPAEQL